MPNPDISFIVPAHNVGRYIEATVEAALAQERISVEIIIVDDASTDETLNIAERLAELDPRIHILRQAHKSGPSLARNAGIEAARGDWIAPLDADDLITPNRGRQLIDLAHQSGCDVVADNLMCFLDGDPDVRWPFLPAPASPVQVEIELSEYLMRNRLLHGNQNLGYLKPIFRRGFLDQHRIRYEETLRIGEDFDFCLRCLVHGAQYIMTSEPSYLYRIRENSLSRQLAPADLRRMLAAFDNVLLPNRTSWDRKTSVAQHAYRRALDTALAYSELRSTVQAGEWQSSARIAATKPSLWYTIGKLAVSKMKRRSSLRAARSQLDRQSS
jgi:succinoglycan biosynthesis protein ExoO